MNPSILRIIVCAFAASAVCACQNMDSYVTVGELRLLAPDYSGVPVVVLARGVEGRDCVFDISPGPISYGNAIANALQKVRGASVMQNVSFEFHDGVYWNCAWVKGDAGRFQ